MISRKTFCDMALAFPYTEQVVHFERLGFRVVGKRMYASYLEENNTANVFLSPREQKQFCETDRKNIYPVPNKWGEKGATTFVLDAVDQDIVNEALRSAYKAVTSPGK